MTEPAAPAPSVPSAGGTPSGNVTRLVHQGREIHIVGTAHVSQKSVEEVRRVIQELRPEAVCVELDASRYETLTDESRWGRLDLTDILRRGRAGLFLSSLLFSAFQKRLGDAVGVRPGAEMLAAIEAAQTVGARVVFADRDIQATLTRCYASLGFLDRTKVVVALATLPFAAADIDEEQIEQLKQREAIGDAMDTFAKQMPSLKRPLIDERDQYLMASTREAEGQRVVAVVGAAHVAGMASQLDTPVDRGALMAVPETSLRALLAGFVIPLLVAGLALVALSRGGEAPAGLLPSLLGPAVLLAATFSAVAGASAVTVFAAAVLAPFAVVTPSPWYGRMVALLQARLRPPAPGDAARVREDVLVPSRFRRNPFLTGLLVGPAARFGRSVGAIIGLVWTALRVI